MHLRNIVDIQEVSEAIEGRQVWSVFSCGSCCVGLNTEPCPCGGQFEYALKGTKDDADEATMGAYMDEPDITRADKLRWVSKEVTLHRLWERDATPPYDVWAPLAKLNVTLIKER